MANNPLSRQQIAFRIAFMLLAVALVTWFLPHNESFRYEYEVGKPWRYGRLTAPYDFAVYRSDSALSQMEDSLQRQVIPRYLLDTSVADSVLRQFNATHHGLTSEARRHLRKALTTSYASGIMLGEAYQQLQQEGHEHVIIHSDDHDTLVSLAHLSTERMVYEHLRGDSVLGGTIASVPLQRYVVGNLVPDTLGMRIEYSRLRQQFSATRGVVLAESRIIDQGEIVTPQIYDVLESYRREQQERLSFSSDQNLMLLARVGLVTLLLFSILLFLYLYRPWLYNSQSEVCIAVGAVVLMFVCTSIADKLLVGGVYLVPIGITTVVLSTFHGSRTSFFCHMVMILLCSFAAPSHYEYLIIQSIVGMIIVFCLKDGLQERQQLLQVSLFSALGYIGSYALYTLATEGTLQNISWTITVMMLGNAILLLISYLIIYILERVFGVVTDVSLSELCNLSRGVLLRLSQEAAGTFNHSLATANLAASAAKRINANVALVRTGAYYHDIGKLWNPGMYTENQEGRNPHDSFTTEESLDIIKRHVSEGVKMAKEANLPNDIIDFIVTHHGAATVKYFYNRWCNEHPGEEPDPRLFCYPGPDPKTKEQAILMLADGAEAATRSLQVYTEEAVAQRVTSVVADVLASGRLNHAKITLPEIFECRESFIHDLKASYHARIEYPTKK